MQIESARPRRRGRGGARSSSSGVWTSSAARLGTIGTAALALAVGLAGCSTIGEAMLGAGAEDPAPASGSSTSAGPETGGDATTGEAPPDVPSVADGGADGGMYGSNPLELGPYRLLTAELVAEAGLDCTGDPLADWNRFETGGQSLAELVYVDAVGLESARAFAGQPCESIDPVDPNLSDQAGILRLHVSTLGGGAADPEPTCGLNPGGNLAQCHQQVTPGVYASIGIARSSDVDMQTRELADLLSRWLAANPRVQFEIGDCHCT